ncbi:MAG: methyltransferase [Xanthomonadales bacterium]|nr:methyltransferase [Xanthomonadales bacterium]
MTTARDIARAYLPGQYHYWYARSKLASDPLYDGVGAALDGCDHPLLDVGCGIGLLAHTLRARGFRADYAGVDIDARKIEAARAAAAKAGLARVRFDVLDLAADFPAHRGTVCILDVLQFVPRSTQARIVDACAACLAPGARLVIRTGLERDGWRLRITRAIDRFSERLGWMRGDPPRYPRREALEAQLAQLGLVARFEPLRGRTPFENWLVTAERAG